MSTESERRWSLTARALDGLLRRLGSDREAAAREYDAIRLKLVGFFTRRNVPAPEALVDETIDRVARRLDEGENVEHLRAYFYGVAKRVMMEWVRRRSRQEKAEGRMPRVPGSLAISSADELEEDQMACLTHCLERLPADSRRLIVSYYQSSAEERRGLATRSGMTYTGLKSQAHRIRIRLGTCVQQCLDAPPSSRGPIRAGDRHA